MWTDASMRTSHGRKDALGVESGDEALFAEKAKRFNDADNSFRLLVQSLAAYKAAVLKATECGVAVATHMEKFFNFPDKDKDQLVSKFRDAQLAIRSKWLNQSEKSFETDVVAPIQSRLDEIPKVRDYIKQRSAALAEMQKRQKKLQSERKRDGPRLRDKQRRLKEISDRYAMFHDEVIQRFNYIDRNMGAFVTAPLRSLVSVMADVAKSSVDSLEDVVKLVAVTPPITKELAPSAPMTTLTDMAGGIIDHETWDDAYAFDDEDEEDDEERDNFDVDENDTDSASARASGRRPPRCRVQSAEAAPKAASMTGLDLALPPIDFSKATSPRRGRSASSAPAEATAVQSPNFPLGLTSTVSGTLQRETGAAPGSFSTRGATSVHESYFLPSVGTSAASSTSTENVTMESGLRAARKQGESFQRRRRRDAKGSGDTVGSGESMVRQEILQRLIAMYDFSPRETNELEIRKGDIIEVSSRNDSGWWHGRCGRDTGYFPRNYTRDLTEEEEFEYAVERRRRRRRGHRRQESHDSKRSGQTATHSSLAVL